MGPRGARRASAHTHVERWGASMYDVHEILEFLDPLPLSLSAQSILFARKFEVFLDPSPSVHTSYVEDPYVAKVS